MDELRIYDRALSHEEIVSLAAVSSVHQFPISVPAPKEMTEDDIINMRDLGTISEQWLE